jgi:hypothetical protein
LLFYRDVYKDSKFPNDYIFPYVFLLLKIFFILIEDFVKNIL